MERFRPYLQGAKHQTIVKSDHANLRSFTTTKDLNPLQTRWAERLGKFDFVIEHLAGRYNPADGPSRRPDYKGSLLEPQETKAFLKLKPFGEDKLEDDQVESTGDDVFIARTTWISDDLSRRIRDALRDDEQAKKIREILREESADDENPWEEADSLLYYNGRVYVPEALRLEIKKRHHDVPLAGHMGQRRTQELVARKFFWPQMKKDIDSYVRGCQLCARNKDNQHATYGQLMPLEPPERPWSRIGFDMITDCPKTKNGNEAIFVIIDHFSKGGGSMQLR
jgi:Integrase zinc binding domain/RNase H-like domain found in reverse transcriptase